MIAGMGSTSSTVGQVGIGIGSSIAKAGAASANPILVGVGAAVMAASAIASALHIGDGCGQTCIEATKVVNDIEPLMQQNVALYKSGQIDQGIALDNFARLWNAVQQACSGIPGAAGKNCIDDRKEGANHWGNGWNWFVGYRDPLLVSYATSNGQIRSTTEGQTTVAGINPIWIGLGLVVVGLMIGGKS